MSRPSVLITGAAKRIGAALARGFSEAGWHVVIHYGRSVREAEALAASLPSAEAVHCDLNDSDAAVAMVEGLAGRLDDWRVLVGNAAIFPNDSAKAADARTLNQVMAVNAKTPVRMAQAFLKHARAKGGRRVIQLTDQKLANPNPDFFSYTLSKHAVAGALPLLAMGAAGPDDRVYGLAPGAILASHDQAEEETGRSHILNLLERRTGADEVVRTALYLAQGWLESGQTLFVDSGQHLLAQPRDVIYLAREAAGG